MAWIRMQVGDERWLPATILVTWASRLLQCSLKLIHRQSSEAKPARALVIRWYACTKCDKINKYCSHFSAGTWFVECRPFLPNTAWYDSSDGRRAVTSLPFSLNCNSMARRNSFVSLFSAKSIGFSPRSFSASSKGKPVTDKTNIQHKTSGFLMFLQTA